jgi:NTE family protein
VTDGVKRRVAIACQGGGSHTAFTAGVLGRLLTAEQFDEYELVGLSGTSGGAVCATLAWSAVCDGDRKDSKPRLVGFWADNAVSGPVETAINAGVLWATTLQTIGLLPAVSPYDVPVTGLDHFRTLLRRWVDFDRIQADDLGRHPVLLIGAVDVLSGEFRAFSSRRERITADMILASAAIPTVFRTVHTAGGSFWDGLFSQNPPVRELLDAQPDELWVIQINPTARSHEPRSVLAIADRRNELAGNLSLYQELHFIEKVDELLADGMLAGEGYKHVTVRIIELPRLRSSRSFGPASKVNRDRRFLDGLIREGETQADAFLHALAFEQAWRRGDVDELMQHLADDATLTFAGSFLERGPAPGQLRDVVRELVRDVRIDVTRKQVTGDRTAWTVRTGDGATAARSRAEAEFRDNRIVRLRLGSAAPA